MCGVFPMRIFLLLTASSYQSLHKNKIYKIKVSMSNSIKTNMIKLKSVK